MKQYLEIVQKAIEGPFKENRTGVYTRGYTGDMMKFDLSEGFPAMTTKKLAFKTCVGEMLAFLRGSTNAADFRALGCKVWDQNANENESWLNNKNRKGVDDLGPIYGSQARRWPAYKTMDTFQGMRNYAYAIDQLAEVYNKLLDGEDNRRLIVSHWNPGENHKMALVPCHVIYKFSLWGDKLHLTMWQRSCDLALGVPFNVAGYAWLLSVMARITNYKVGTFTWFGDDIHIYENHIGTMRYVQLKREPYALPRLEIHPNVRTLRDLETWVTPEHFRLVGYTHHDAINYEMNV